MADTEFAIVGAGAAGLAAAKVMRAAGRSVTVLEALPRIGGRAWTTSEWFGLPFDIGCAWLHGADRNPFFPEAQAAGWTLHEHDMSLDHLYFGGRKGTPEELAAVLAADADLETALAAHKGEHDTLEGLIRAGHARRASATFAGPMDFGADFDEISIADFSSAEDLDPNYFTKEGFGALVARFGADVPVRMGHPVRRIDWAAREVALEGEWGRLTAEKVLVTSSPAVLAFEEIAFTPDLPATHMGAAHDLPMGLLTKIPLLVEGDRLGLKPFDDVLIERPGLHDIFFLAFPFDSDLMVGFVGGDFAWEMEAAGEEAAVDFATDRLVAIFGSSLRRQVRKGHMTHWSGERFMRGAYAVARPGRASARAALARPVEGRLYFAGEHLARGLKQTCAGARLSGEAAAREMMG